MSVTFVREDSTFYFPQGFRWDRGYSAPRFLLPSNLWILDQSYQAEAVPQATYARTRFDRLGRTLAVQLLLLSACRNIPAWPKTIVINKHTSAVEPGARIAFELTSKQGAALITKYPTYRERVERGLRFENYIKRHYESWVEFALEQEHPEDVKPILVTGVSLTREFATVAYSDNRTRMECEFSATLPAVASTSVSVWGSWNTPGLVHTNCGPDFTQQSPGSSESSAPESKIPDEYTQCVFIRYYTIRKRLLFPTVVKAGAGPHQLPKGSHDSGEEGVLSVDDPTEVEYPETGCPGEMFEEVVPNVPTVGPKQ